MESKQIIRLTSREYGKRTDMLQSFYNSCERDESTVFLMPKGEVHSPKSLSQNFIPKSEAKKYINFWNKFERH